MKRVSASKIVLGHYCVTYRDSSHPAEPNESTRDSLSRTRGARRSAAGGAIGVKAILL